MKNILKRYVSLKNTELQKVNGGKTMVRYGTTKEISNLWKSIKGHLHIG